MQKSNEILISLLTFNSSEVIEECLNSLKNQSNQNFRCFVFDNNSHDDIEKILKKYKWVTFVKVGKNDGYSGGHNFAINYFRKNFPNHKYMMVLNPDTFLSSNLIDEYQKLFRLDSTFYTCVTKKTNSDKRYLTGKKIHLPSFTFLERYLQNSEFKRGYSETPFVVGSCFVVNLEKYKLKNLFKDYFMYHEEIELSIRHRIKGGKILCTTRGYVVHIAKKQSELNLKTVYLLEINRLKLQSDLFSDLFTLINLPFYTLYRIFIFAFFKPMSHATEYSRGINDGLKYFQKNIGKKKASFFRTIKFLFFEN